MDEIISLLVFKSGNDGGTEREVDKLKEVLQQFGIDVVFTEKKENDFASVEFKYNTDKIKTKATRNAGRKTTKITDVTIKDVRQLIKEQGAVKAAEKIGMSKSQMYVRLRAAEKYGFEDEYI